MPNEPEEEGRDISYYLYSFLLLCNILALAYGVYMGLGIGQPVKYAIIETCGTNDPTGGELLAKYTEFDKDCNPVYCWQNPNATIIVENAALFQSPNGALNKYKQIILNVSNQ